MTSNIKWFRCVNPGCLNCSAWLNDGHSSKLADNHFNVNKTVPLSVYKSCLVIQGVCLFEASRAMDIVSRLTFYTYIVSEASLYYLIGVSISITISSESRLPIIRSKVYIFQCFAFSNLLLLVFYYPMLNYLLGNGRWCIEV